MNYWSGASSRKAKAIADTTRRAQKCRAEIHRCIDGIVDIPHGKELSTPRPYGSTQLVFEQCGSVQAVEESVANAGGRVCVLDFASYNNPGGKYLDGSSAQEECLCHSSILYNVLSSELVRGMFYNQHRGRSNRCLYSDHLLYIPSVLFESGCLADVIVCAAPNKGAAMHYNNVSSDEADKVMSERCYSVPQAAAHIGVDTLVLGAFGCGVFKNNPRVVAETFKSLLSDRFDGCFNKVVFAVPDEYNGRYFKVICV